MKTTVMKEASATTSVWSGGISKQYYIFPLTAEYADRNFLFRMSLATSTTDAKMDYSNLFNITRHLIMLNGTAHVFHQDHYDMVLHPYAEIDVFDGGWRSSAIGKVTDFNLMTAGNAHGKMSVVDQDSLTSIGGYCAVCHKSFNRTAFFCGCGSADFAFSTGELVHLSQRELLLIEDFPPDLQANINLTEAKLVRMDVCCY